MASEAGLLCPPDLRGTRVAMSPREREIAAGRVAAAAPRKWLAAAGGGELARVRTALPPLRVGMRVWCGTLCGHTRRLPRGERSRRTHTRSWPMPPARGPSQPLSDPSLRYHGLDAHSAEPFETSAVIIDAHSHAVASS